MKKILMLTALCAVIMASVGCQNNENVDQEVNNPNTNIEENVNNNQEDNKQPVEDNKEPEQPVEDNKEPEQPAEDNKEPEQPVEDNKEPEVVEPGTSQAYLDLEKIVNEISENAKVQINAPFNMEITAEASFTYLGLAEEDYTKTVEVGVANESMMMPSNHSFCLLKVKEGTDIATLKQSIYDNCNPRKWICMSAQYVLVAGNGDYVMLAMSSKENCENLLKAFEAKFGKDASVLQRVAEEF